MTENKKCKTCRHEKLEKDTTEDTPCQCCQYNDYLENNWEPKKIIQKELEGFIGYYSDGLWCVYPDREQRPYGAWDKILKCKVIFEMEED